MAQEIEPVLASVEVPLGAPDAFALFCDLGRWWPLAYTFSEAGFAGGAVDRREWFEIGPSGARQTWGAVHGFAPPDRLVLAWGIGADRKPAPPERSSEIEVRFDPAAAGRATVRIEHRRFDRHGADGEALRAGMASGQGWPLILAEFARAARLRV